MLLVLICSRGIPIHCMTKVSSRKNFGMQNGRKVFYLQLDWPHSISMCIPSCIYMVIAVPGVVLTK